MRNNKKAFTLIELLVVVTLIGILSTIGIVSYAGFVESAAQKSAENTLSAVALAQQEYKSNNGRYYTAGPTSTCTPSATTNTEINKNLFADTQTENLTQNKRYDFCVAATQTTYALIAKHKTKACQITLNQLNSFLRPGCDG